MLPAELDYLRLLSVQFLIREINFFIVQVDDNIEFGFWEVQEKRVCSTCKYTFTSIEDINILESE